MWLCGDETKRFRTPHTVSLQTLTKVTDTATGSSRNTYATVKTLRCKVEPLQGRELLLSRTEQAEMSHRIMLRYDPLVTPQSRLLYQDKAGNQHTLDVQSVANIDEANQRLEVLALEREKVA